MIIFWFLFLNGKSHHLHNKLKFVYFSFQSLINCISFSLLIVLAIICSTIGTWCNENRHCWFYSGLIFFFFLPFLGPQQWHVEVPKLGVQIRTTDADPCHSHSHGNAGSKSRLWPIHSSWQHLILDPLSEARDQTCILMDTSLVSFHCTTTGTPLLWILMIHHRMRSLSKTFGSGVPVVA